MNNKTTPSLQERVRYAEYKLKANRIITKDGHTMMLADIVSDLNRKSYLEEAFKEEQAKNKRLTAAKCECTPDETTGWTTFKLCNICGNVLDKQC